MYFLLSFSALKVLVGLQKGCLTYKKSFSNCLKFTQPNMESNSRKDEWLDKSLKYQQVIVTVTVDWG